MRSYFFAGTVRTWKVVVPDLGTVEGRSRSRRWNMAASMTAR